MSGADETELFDPARAPAGAGFRLVASWGPRRWRTGQPNHGPMRGHAAYTPDGDTLVFAGTRTLVVLDRRGHAVCEPHVVPGTEVAIRVAAGGTRAIIVADRSVLTVIELPSMREVFRGQAWGAYDAILSGDGETFACGPRVHRVRDGAVIEEMSARRLLGLSRDGSHALYVVQETPGSDARVVLRAVGVGDVRETRSRQVSYQSAFRRDGRYVAWGRRDDLVIWETRAGGSFHVAGPGTLGPFCFVGEDLMVHTDRALRFLAPNGAVRREIAGPTGWLIAAHEGARRALFRGDEGPRELDLVTGARLEPAPAPCAEVTRVVWDHQSRAAAVLRADGDLRLWDVQQWRTTQLIDPRRELIARTPKVGGYSQWTFRSELVSLAFTRDGERLVVSDPSAVVSLLTRDGSLVWRRAFAPDPSWPSGWKWLHASQEDTGTTIEVRVAWSWHRGHDPDGTPILEDRVTVTTLDPGDGRVLAHRDEPAWTPNASTALPRVHLVLQGAGGTARVGAETLPVPELLGTVTGVFLSPDERTLLIATSARLLLRFDREDEPTFEERASSS